MIQVRAWLAANSRTLAKVELALAIGIPLLFLVLAIIKATPFVDDLPLAANERDDWWSYKNFATIIIREGWVMPSVGPYITAVHAPLYNYFVAVVFKIFGENTSYVYVVHSLMVGGSVSLLYLLIRGRVSHIAAIAFLVVTALQLYVDYFRWISFRLLSENLFLFLFSVVLLTYVWAFEHRSHAAAAIAGILLGLTVLSRTSALASAVGLIAAGLAYFLVRRRTAPLTLTVMVATGFALAMGLLPLREYLATGQPDIGLLQSRNGWDIPPAELSAYPEYYARRVLFTFGFAGLLIDAFRFRPYWLVMWLGFFGYVASRFWWRRTPDLREVAVLVLFVLYMGPVIVLGDPANYGGRMVSVALPLVMILGARFISDLFDGSEASAPPLATMRRVLVPPDVVRREKS